MTTMLSSTVIIIAIAIAAIIVTPDHHLRTSAPLVAM